ncbi:MAG: DUF5060 domain-containing protein [Planctomycetota bacterium]|nr:MAG: DUF5060 domain-containing protein [Planctomycetota bacterium]
MAGRSTICEIAVGITCALWPAAVAQTAFGETSVVQETPQFHVIELACTGPMCGPMDAPARDVELSAVFRHAISGREIRVWGFWDGDGRGGETGNVFKVRFCPDEPGLWRVVETASNCPELRGSLVGTEIRCRPSDHPGFWVAEGGWYRRSNGSLMYIVGNTHYTFLSRRTSSGALKVTITDDIRRNAEYFKKLRFSLVGGRYVRPDIKPFFDPDGRPSDDGRYSFRPNPRWFHDRADAAVRAGFDSDLICDLILCGPDTVEARSTLEGDPEPWLRYVAARYGSYPNVWFCLCNEWDIKTPHYKAEDVRRFGAILRRYLPYGNPVSIHGAPGPWKKEIEGDWNDHRIIQWKLKTIARAADAAAESRLRPPEKPLVNDENAYEGDGDRFTEADVVEGCFGTFLGGGYPTTGEKYGRKLGQYFWGGFDASKHKAADNLRFLRRYIDEYIDFGRMHPLPLSETPFVGVPDSFRVLGCRGREYVLGSDAAVEVTVRLPSGRWRIVQVDLITMTSEVRYTAAAGTIALQTPPSRAGLLHVRRLNAETTTP